MERPPIAAAVAALGAQQAGVAAPAQKARDEVLQIPALDGIRAMSISIVFLAHAGLGRLVPGYFGLTLFFFLSGFLITTLLRIEFDRTRTISLQQFYLRRVLRIFPPFYLVLLVVSIATELGLLGGSLSLGGVLSQVFHFTNYRIVSHGWWDGIAPGSWVYWSLAVEEHFYLVFPLLYLWLLRKVPDRGRQVLVLLGVCALVLAWRCVLVYGFHASKDRTYVASDTRVDSIIAGCILAIWRNPVLDRERIDDGKWLYVWFPLGVLAVLASLVIRVPSFEQSFRYTLQSFGLLPFFLVAVRNHARWPFRILDFAPIRRIGVFSYSIYLMHTTLLWALERSSGLGTLPRGVLAALILIVLASLIYRYVEKPFARVRRRMSSHLTAPAAGGGS